MAAPRAQLARPGTEGSAPGSAPARNASTAAGPADAVGPAATIPQGPGRTSTRSLTASILPRRYGVSGADGALFLDRLDHPTDGRARSAPNLTPGQLPT